MMSEAKLRPVSCLLCCGLASLACAKADTDDDVIPLAQMVVSATGNAHSTLTAPAALTVIDRAMIEASPEPTLTSLLSQVPGVSLVGRGVGGRKVISLRGMESQHALILIDGRRISATDDVIGHSDLQYNWLSLDAVERIEVIRGPMSALYGSEALGGVINIITLKGRGSFSGTIHAQGTLDTKDNGGGNHNLSTSLHVPLGETLALDVNLASGNRDDVLSPDDARVSDIEGKKYTTGQLALSWQLTDSQSLTLNSLYTDEDTWYQTNYRGQAPFYRSMYDINRQQHSLEWQGDFDVWSGRLAYYRADIDVVNSNDHETINAYTPQFLTDDIVETGFYRDFGLNRLTLGAEWRNEQLQHSAFINNGDDVIHKAVLAQYEWQIVDDMALTLGNRWDHHGYFGSEMSPRAYLVWQPATAWAVKFGYGHGFKAPTLKQISPEYRFDGPHSFVGNPELKPESSDNVELGIRYESVGNTAISATVFNNKVTDLIATECVENCSVPFGRVNEYVNVNEARIKGVEFELNTNLGERNTFNSSYTYTDGHDEDNNQKLPNRPRHQATIGINRHWFDERLSAGMQWQYIGKQWINEPNQQIKLPNYQLVNAQIQYRMNQHSFSLKLNNLTNTVLSEESDDFGYALYGRNIRLGWRMHF